MMNFLLDPNVAYLVLLAGVVLIFAALVTPGTGLLEIGALFCVLLAGYIIYNLSFNWWAIVLLLLSIVPFVYAIQKPKRGPFLILVVILLGLGSVFIFPRTDQQAAVNPVLAILSSGFVAGFIWIVARKSVEAFQARPVYNPDKVIGAIGKTKTIISDDGSVQIDGELWSARSDNLIPIDTPVRVIGREGFVLVVEKTNSLHS